MPLDSPATTLAPGNLPLVCPLVCVVAYDGLCTFEFGVCVEVFGLSRPELEVPWYQFEVVAGEPGPFRATGGVVFEAREPLSRLADADLVLIPGWRGIDAPVPAPLVDAIRRTHAGGARIASICSGVAVLARAGLLDGRRATTHWRYIAELQRAYPSIELCPDTLYVDHGDVLTSAGSAAGIDLCLHIVRQDFGTAVANSVAQRLVMPAHRDGGQSQFIPKPINEPGDQSLAALLDVLRQRIAEPWTITDMAALAKVSPRTLLRKFNAATGDSPHQWLTRERVGRARDLLENSDAAMSQIAERAGFVTPETLRHHFRQILGTSPRAYRRAFRSRSGAHQAIAEPRPAREAALPPR